MGSEGKASSWTAARIVREVCDLRLVLSRAEEETLEAAAGVVGRLMRFREKTVRPWPPTKIAEHLMQLAGHPLAEQFLQYALILDLLRHKRPLLSAFYDACGVPHQNGETKVEGVPVPVPAVVRKAVEGLRGAYEPRDIAAFLAVLGLRAGKEWQPVVWPLADEIRAGIDAPSTAIKAADAETEAARPPEDSDELTTLDLVLIDAIVAAASETRGCLTADAAEDLVEEVIQLSAHRHRSYFHRGFLQRLMDLDPAGPFVEENPTRRAWLLAGEIMALARKQDRTAITDLYRRRRADYQEILQQPPGCAVVPAQRMFYALWDEGEYADAVQALPTPVVAHSSMAFMRDLMDRATTRLRSHDTQSAKLLLQRIADAWALREHGEETDEEFGVKLDRRLAQCLRAEGQFQASVDRFGEIRMRAPRTAQAEVHADLGLALGGFRWLSEVEVPPKAEDRAEMLRRLRKGDMLYRQALRQGGHRRTNAYYALGVLALLEERDERPEEESALRLLEQAYSGASQEVDTYRQGDVYPRIELYYGFAILLAIQQPQFPLACELIMKAASAYPPSRWPRWFLAKLRPILALDPEACLPLIEWAQGLFPDLVDEALRDVGVLRRSESLWRRLSALSTDPQRRPDDRWEDACALARFGVACSLPEVGGAALDTLWELARQHHRLREPFLERLADHAFYEPVWEERDARLARADIHERLGDHHAAASEILQLFHERVADRALCEAEDLLDRLRTYRVAGDTLASAEARLAALASRDVERAPAPAADPLARYLAQPNRGLSILLVGGNETQARYDDAIEQHFAATRPNLRVRFVHSGWESNWARFLDEATHLLPQADGLVVHYFLRTQFGRKLRKLAGDAGKEWGSCSGHGRDSMIRGIEAVARRVASARLHSST